WRRSTIERLEDRWMLSVNAPALHSNAGASKTIYLDFDGHNIRNTPWNTNGFGNLINLPFDTDGDLASFSDDELQVIQSVWERVSEDFRPFDVDVTTVDPGFEALKNTGGTDADWGQRIVIGDSAMDWYAIVNPPAAGATPPTFVFKTGSFSAPVPTDDND